MSVVFTTAQSEALPAADTVIYVCPSNAKSAMIIGGSCNNSTGVSADLTTNIVLSAESVAVTNEYITDATILMVESNPLLEIVGKVLLPGDFISAIAGTAASLNFKISIKEIF